METKTIDVHKEPIQLRDLVPWMAAGKEIILTEGPTPIARVVPLHPSNYQRTAGLHAGTVWVSPDFDEPLSEDFWSGNVAME